MNKLKPRQGCNEEDKMESKLKSNNQAKLDKRTENDIKEHKKAVYAFFTIELILTIVVIVIAGIAYIYSEFENIILTSLSIMIVGIGIILFNEYRSFRRSKKNNVITGLGMEILLGGIMILIINELSKSLNSISSFIKLLIPLCVITLLIIIILILIKREITKAGDNEINI